MAHISFKRIMKSGMQHVWRNGTVTFASILVTTVTLLVIAMLLFVNAILGFSLNQISEKVDVNIYFYPNAEESVILDVKGELEDLDEVSEVTYISRDDALEQFRERHKDDRLTLQALEELGDNPLGASLNIRTFEPSQYDDVAAFLAPDGGLSGTTQSMIEKINYHQNQRVIERVNSLLNTIERLGLVITIIFIALSVIITVNTLRLAIYASREEISVMQLVGADRGFVQGPFYVAGATYGLISAALTIIILYPLTSWMARQTTDFFGGLSVFDYYIVNFAWMILIILAAGVVIGIIASALAVRGYLRK